MHRLQEVWMEDALHDLCQPLTALQCRLFLATLAAGGGRQEEMERAVTDALRQCERAIGLVRAMQDKVVDQEFPRSDQELALEAR